MVFYVYDSVLAYNPSTASVVKSAVYQVYDISDTANATPLATTDLGGLPVTVTSNSDGMLTIFRVADRKQVKLVSGQHSQVLTAITAVVSEVDSLRADVTTIQDQIEDGTIGGGGVDDAGMAELISDPASSTSIALVERYGQGAILLDPDDPVPVGTAPGTIIYRVAGGGGPGPGPTPVIFAQDTFERVVASGWGTADSGSPYQVVVGSSGLWSVGSGAGRYVAPGAGSALGWMLNQAYSQASVEVEGVISQEVASAGSRLFGITPRRIPGSSNYSAVISMRAAGSTRPLQIDLSLNKSGTLGDLSSTSPGVLTSSGLGQKIRFKVQVLQVDAATTRVRARIWFDGSAEPNIWHKDTTDTTPALQVPGELMFSVQQSAGETVASEARLHEYVARSIVNA